MYCIYYFILILLILIPNPITLSDTLSCIYID